MLLISWNKKFNFFNECAIRQHIYITSQNKKFARDYNINITTIFILPVYINNIITKQ